jgi:hypothetical protein
MIEAPKVKMIKIPAQLFTAMRSGLRLAHGIDIGNDSDAVSVAIDLLNRWQDERIVGT